MKEEIKHIKEKIYSINKKNKIDFRKEIKKNYKDVFLVNGGYGKKGSRYEYDFIWQDIEYIGKYFRICFYSQDIDLNSYNVHIYHGKYTFQKELIKNSKGSPYSIFDKHINLGEGFKKAKENMKYSNYGIDNFDLKSFVKEFLNFINYKN